MAAPTYPRTFAGFAVSTPVIVRIYSSAQLRHLEDAALLLSDDIKELVATDVFLATARVRRLPDRARVSPTIRLHHRDDGARDDVPGTAAP